MAKSPRKLGVLLVNLGTPDGTDYWSMRRYLKEFLWDRRVVEFPRPLWWLVLNGVILTFRPSKSGQAYKKIWNKEKDESPLRTITRDTNAALKERLSDKEEIVVTWGMRYGSPSIRHGLYVLQEKKKCDRILIVPLYPQYSATTTASVNDKAYEYLATLRLQPTLRSLAPYFEDERYIAALKKSMLEGLSNLDFEPEVILMSFHGIPKRYIKNGDPYEAQCERTAELLREAMGMSEDKLKLTYQSRLGREPWLSPYTDETLEELGQSGIKNVAVITPGFAADCVETLEEIALEGGDIFKENGGENFAMIPCLNDSTTAIDMLESLVLDDLKGWM